MLDIPEDTITKSKKFLANYASTWTNGVCTGAVKYFDFKNVAEIHTACHAWVGYGFSAACFKKGIYNYSPWNQKYHEDAQNFLTLNVMSKHRCRGVCSPEAVTFLSRWIALESPFSEYVLNRDDEESLENGHILLCGPDGLNLTEAMWMCKVSRLATEAGQAADVFMELVKGGVDGMLAVYIASLVTSYKGAVFGYTGVIGHSTVIDPRKTSPAAYLQRNVNKTANETPALFSYDKALPGNNITGEKAGEVVRGFCKPFKKPDGWGGFIQGKGADRETFIGRALEWQKELTAEPVKPVKKKPTKDTVFLEMDM